MPTHGESLAVFLCYSSCCPPSICRLYQDAFALQSNIARETLPEILASARVDAIARLPSFHSCSAVMPNFAGYAGFDVASVARFGSCSYWGCRSCRNFRHTVYRCDFKKVSCIGVRGCRNVAILLLLMLVVAVRQSWNPGGEAYKAAGYNAVPVYHFVVPY